MLHAVKAYVPAVLCAYLLASMVATQIILAEVTAMGVAVPLADRLAATLHDIRGMTSSYLPLIAIAFVLALPVASGLGRLLPQRRALLYSLAGFVAVVALHLIMKAVLGVSGIAAARSLPGLLSQGAAGAVGGLCFYAITRRNARR